MTKGLSALTLLNMSQETDFSPNLNDLEDTDECPEAGQQKYMG